MLLSPALPPGSRVKEIEWSFSAGAGATIQVAEFGPGGFERPDPHDRFKQRLEMLNATALRIGGLELGDSGVYGARIKLHPALVEDQAFNLSVYGERCETGPGFGGRTQTSQRGLEKWGKRGTEQRGGLGETPNLRALHCGVLVGLPCPVPAPSPICGVAGGRG